MFKGGNREPLALLVVSYVAAKVLMAASEGPWHQVDTQRYEMTPVGFLGEHDILWLMPAVMNLHPWAVLVLQTVVSAVAFIVLAVAIGRQMNSDVVRVTSMAVVLLVGVSARVVVHDTSLMTESLAVSFTLVLLALATELRTAPAWAVLGTYTLWTFVRDAHALFGVVVATMIGIVLWRYGRRAVAVLVALVAVWGVAASQNNRFIEANNITTIVHYRAVNDEALMSEFEASGMPAVAAYEASGDIADLHGDEAFQAWAGSEGSTTYMRWLVSNPVEVFDSLPHLFGGDGAIHEGIRTLEPRVDLAVPHDSFMLTAALLIAAIAMVWRRSRRGDPLDGRMTVPAVGLACVLPTALLAHFGSAINLNRHLTVPAIVLVVCAWWLFLLGIDDVVSRARPGGVQGGDRRGVGGGEQDDRADVTAVALGVGEVPEVCPDRDG